MSSAEARSYQSQLSIDLSDVASVSDVVTKLQDLNLDIVGFARENVGTFVSVSSTSHSQESRTIITPGQLPLVPFTVSDISYDIC